jgi:hypothetical protein
MISGGLVRRLGILSHGEGSTIATRIMICATRGIQNPDTITFQSKE